MHPDLPHILGCDLLERLGEHRRSVTAPPYPGGSIDVGARARATPTGRRLRAVERAVRDGQDFQEVFYRCSRVGTAISATTPDRRSLVITVLGAALDAEFLEIATSSRGPELVPGLNFVERPGLRDIALTHPAASLIVGAQALANGPEALDPASDPDITTALLPLTVVAAVAQHRRVGVEELCVTLEHELLDRGYGLDVDVAGWITRSVRRALLLLADLGWVEVRGGARDRVGDVRATHLGLVGILMTHVRRTGVLPEALADEALRDGWLPARDGYINPSDLPFPVLPN